MKIVTFFVFLCSTLHHCSALNKTQKLIWSQSPLLPLPLSTILKIQGDPRQWIQQKEPQLEAVSGKSIHEWGSVIRGLGFSYRHNVLVWSEVVGRRIRAVVLDRPGNHPVDLFTGTSSEVNGVAVDWINSNVYWTDGLYSWLVMAPLRFHPDPSPHVLPAEPLKRVFRIVVQDGLDNPRSVAVHPLYNWLLLSDRGVRPRIERTDLLGQNREVLVDRDMVAPTGLVIDMVSCRLFWADQVKATVESVLLRGPDRQRTVIFREGGWSGSPSSLSASGAPSSASSSSFFDVALFENYLFLTDQLRGVLKIVHVNSKKGRQKKKKEEEEKKKRGGEGGGEEGQGVGEEVRTITLDNYPNGIVMFDPSLQPGGPGGCERAGCQHMCVEMDHGTPLCVCGDGFDLMDDGVHCVEHKDFPQPCHVYAMGLALCLYPAHIADMSMVNVSLTTQCSVLPPNNYGYLALGFDARRNLLFFSANYTRTISAVRMEAGALPWVVVSGTGVVKGLAVDWVTGALYWTDSSRGHVMVARWDGSFQNVLLQDQVTRPLGIAVHPRRGRIYWTDLGLPSLVKPTLESANMDGSERRVLVSGDALGRPNHVFIDYTKDKLYWADSARNKVMQYDLNSGQWGTFFALPRFKVYGITLYRNYLLWTDMEDMNGIHMARLDIKRRVRSIIHPGYGRAADLITVDRVLQPDMASPCKKSRMLCEQLCLPRGPGNHTCFCGLGFTLEGGMVCTPGKIARDNFLLVTDAHQRNVYQIDVSTGVIRAVTQGERHQPIAVDFLPGAPGMPGTVFWSDNEAHVIRRTRLGGHRWPSTFLDLPEDSKVEGVAVSAEHRLLYFTDVGRHVIGVADLGDHGGSRYRHAVVVSEGLTHPRDIVIYSARGTGVGKIYWTDWGPKATISGAYLSGEHRSVLVSFNRTAWVNGLAVDRIGHSLYWADAYNNEVGVYNLSSGQHRTLLSTPAAHFYGLYVMNSFIYLTDWSRRFVLRVPKSGGQLMQFGEGKFNKLFGITGYDSAADRSKQGRGVCADQRRCGLQALCVPRTHLTFTCVCFVGHVRKGRYCHRNSTELTNHTDRGVRGHPMHHHRTMPGDFHGDGRSGIKGARKHHALKGGAGRTGVVVVCVVAVVVFLASAGLGVACFYRRSRSRSFRVPHARLQEAAAQAQGTATTPTQQNRPPDRSEGPTPAGPTTVRQTPTAPIPTPTNTHTNTHTHTAGRAPPPLSHLKVFYSRRPSAEQVRIEEGLDNPSYDEAAVSMMPGGRPVMRQSGSEDNQPTL